MKDLLGLRFSRLVVKSFSHTDKKYHHYWKCVCDCGNETITRASRLLCGACQSCGCLIAESARKRNLKHGGFSAPGQKYKHGNPTYIVWVLMLARCANPKSTAFKDYGGRGISVCERWEKFSNFIEDMGPRPSFEHSIGRINNDGNYEPSNCRWETREQQANNTRASRIETFNGVTDTITRLARMNGLSPMRVISRLSCGWTVEESLSTPVNEKQSMAIKQSWNKRNAKAA